MGIRLALSSQIARKIENVWTLYYHSAFELSCSLSRMQLYQRDAAHFW